MSDHAVDSVAARADQMKRAARELGFDACGIARAEAPDPEDRLGAWLERGYHADMAWMARTRAARQDPQLLLPGAKSVIVVARNYHHPRPEQPPGSGKVAAYAWGRDYHKVLRRPLRALAATVEGFEPGARTYCRIDSGPVLERAWAARAGVGWIGRNSLVLRRDLGSWFFLGVILTTVELAPDRPVEDCCGSCRACIDACPTRAIVAPGVVDSRLCISYHTIENRGEIPEALHAAFRDWVFGCDICQEVCPWNRFAKTTDEAAFHPRPGVAHPALAELAEQDEDAFNARFAGTPVRRAKHGGMLRNARIALGNAKR
ncbi:MAG TPA: tRNA epoxyqueuosine(34) reductase QueG [Candidatus Hydrogenedentes bacterium]|nr:tRNA epoxyqueuosine(34) reductase QueG [Candidatus Hydrogenedentota bacterium]HNT86541.1 tRNA epoxyqueuosine(34) reductase QueG [Candidatus Hydrogenedentota bacterium]